MPTVELMHVSKSFGTLKAVDDVSLTIEQGELFGLLGPNGAGKTTCLRCLLDIFKPESGSVSILGGPMDEEKKNRIGYMPEERGLYQDIPLDRCLTYLGSLKGLSPAEVRKRTASYLERFDLAAHQRKKVKELSKGMQQKAQVIATLLHQPELIIVDEPFSGLDPVNVQMIKDLLLEEHHRGVTIILCSHQMHQVEELCQRIGLIDYGRLILYGELDSIRREFTGHDINLQSSDPIPVLKGVGKIERMNGKYRLQLAPGTKPQDVLKQLVSRNITLEQFEIAVPSLDEIFIRVVQGKGGA